MRLCLHPLFHPSYAHPTDSITQSWASYPLTTDGFGLFWKWYAPYPTDPLLSGILADWLEDHLEELLSGASGPDPTTRLHSFIHSLRDRFEGR